MQVSKALDDKVSNWETFKLCENRRGKYMRRFQAIRAIVKIGTDIAWRRAQSA